MLYAPDRRQRAQVLWAEHPRVHVDRITVHHHCRTVLPLRVQRISEICRREQRIRMLWAEHLLLRRERAAVHRHRRRVLALCCQHTPEVHGRGQQHLVL